MVPFTKSLNKSFKTFVTKRESKSTPREATQTKPPGGPKDRNNITHKSVVIYGYKYDRLECDEEQIGKSPRTSWERLKEYVRVPSSIYDYANTRVHHTKVNNFSLVGWGCTTSQEPSRRPSTSGSMIYHSIGILASSNCPIYWMRPCLLSLISTSSNPLSYSGYPLCMANIPS